ncbi:uncharacterized protein E5676_scaffold205G001410 [Cucumis melo var. makuwa]|uniref:Ubiquitin-like protease family profile domain-containing protein n=1 Tax=Cucumis melo var. makuwa TaxID=1194695 RepID=A0A5D3DM41_CUCMM|nr:uncharacterized protein E5676_scaffold205G001410 [Cucumis melo var. makuwa]
MIQTTCELIVMVLMDCCSDDNLSVGADEDIAQVDCFLKTSSQRSMCGPTTMIHLTQISSDANLLVVDYNECGEWIGENATQMDKLQKDVDKTYSVSDDILTQALGTPEHRGRVRGVGGLITPSFYFHRHIPSEPKETHITVDVDANWKKEKSQILSEYSQMTKKMLKLKSLKRTRETSLDAHSGCNQNIGEKQFISTSIHHMKKIDLGRPCNLAIGKVDNIVATGTVFERISTDEIVYGVRLREGDVRVLIELAFDTQEIFGYSFNVNMMKDSIKQLCLMEELALLVILSYMTCLYESDPSILEKYAFMNPGQISKGLCTNEHRARHFCLRMFYAKTNTRARPLTWVSVKCAQQPGSTECGYYVIKFMQDIVRQKSITITDVLMRQAPYTQSDWIW